ncbi:MAG: type II toxin-antitoxin system VapC family toxin [Chitinivibrionia bacterium]|nr:type II toxin-antitoxin system VapC family toxin [Chitinivibrionia bacterium]
MIKYLLDTNICAFFFGGKYGLDKKFNEVGITNCAVSEITIAELKYGIELSFHKEKNLKNLNKLMEYVSVIPIKKSISLFAKEKARLKKLGKIIDDFDLLIGTTAVANNLIMISDNTRHLSRIENINIQNWIKI